MLSLTHTFRDKAGRSVPAPGRGALTIGRELHSKYPLPILDVAYRSRQLAFRRSQIAQWLANEQHQLQEEIEFRKGRGNTPDADYLASRIADMEKEAARQEKDALTTYGMLQGADPRVAPLRRALAVWGLTADDIGVLSIHGTGTGANVSVHESNMVPLLTLFGCRRRMKPTFGMISLLISLALLVTQSQSWLRRACAATPKVDRLPGNWRVCYRAFKPELYLATVTPSELFFIIY